MPQTRRTRPTRRPGKLVLHVLRHLQPAGPALEASARKRLGFRVENRFAGRKPQNVLRSAERIQGSDAVRGQARIRRSTGLRLPQRPRRKSSGQKQRGFERQF
uniref:Uncharacterized protein n=1 Tax=Panagrolaimus sp. JU765 TaxID=591449 RepID=A0AC34Q1I4_9BILA